MNRRSTHSKWLRRTTTTMALTAIAVLYAVSIYAASHESKEHSHEAKMDIVDTAVAAGSFNTLATALTEAGLIKTLKGEGPFTVFAPTDDAFAKLPEGAVEELLADKKKLTSILTYHVAPGDLHARDVMKSVAAMTVNGQSVVFNVDKDTGKVYVDGAEVVKADIETSNGIIHVIDSVIMPKDLVDTAAAAGKFNTLLTAAKAAELVDTLKSEGPLTLFAPTDAAFEKLPEGTIESLLADKRKLRAVLTYHVVPGKKMAEDVLKMESIGTANGAAAEIKMVEEKPMIDGAGIIATDIVAANGVIHVIDTVMLP